LWTGKFGEEGIQAMNEKYLTGMHDDG